MSYCRWSTDNFKCDLYVYESVHDCWTIHIATNRLTEEITDTDKPFTAWIQDPENKEKLAAYNEASEKQSEELETVERESIGLPHDGEQIDLLTAGECADKIQELIDMGYSCPQYVVDTLKKEHIENSDDLTP